MNKRKTKIRKVTIRIVAGLLLTITAYMYVNERPGGLADWSMSRALGLEDTMRIPLSSSPEEAIRQFRSYDDNVEVIHQELVAEGMILFTHRKSKEPSTNDNDNNNIQLEFVRKNIFGWKWVWGGGFSFPNTEKPEYALHYMSMPKLEDVSTPFPMMFGMIEHPATKRITTETGEEGQRMISEAKFVQVRSGEFI